VDRTEAQSWENKENEEEEEDGGQRHGAQNLDLEKKTKALLEAAPRLPAAADREGAGVPGG
jgi:hypothetical protein